jgi:hypothetical protein
MTVRELYDAVLIEMNKEKAQSFTLEEFNYILNKSILAFENDRYKFYPVNQQLSDALKNFTKTQEFSINDVDVTIDPTIPQVGTFNTTTAYIMHDITVQAGVPIDVEVSSVNDLNVGDIITLDKYTASIGSITGNTINISSLSSYYVKNGENVKVYTDIIDVTTDISNNRLVTVVFKSSDYMHLLSCRTVWRSMKVDGKVVQFVFPAKRLTFDMHNAIENNSYLAPAPNRPYYQVFDNPKNSSTTNILNNNSIGKYYDKPEIKIHIGKAINSMELIKVEIDYLKLPQYVELKESDIYQYGEDNSQILEIPSYLKNDIVRRCVAFLLEKTGDPRMQTQPAFNQEIPSIPTNMGIQSAPIVSPQQTKEGQ